MKRLIITLFLNICLVSASYAVDIPEKITLPQALDIAVQNNIDYKSAKIDVDIAKNKIKEANRLQNPDFNIFYNFGSAGRGNPQQIGLSETIEIAKRGARKKLAKSNLELTKQNVGYFEFDLKMDVREAYVNLVAAKSVLNALEQQQQLLKDLLEVSKKRVATGASPEMDILQAEIALNQMITQVNTAKVNVKAATIEFNKVINPKEKTDVQFDSADELFNDKENFIALLTPKPDINVPSFDEITENTLKNRFDIRIAKQQIDVAEKNLKVVARQRIPDLAIQGGYGYQPKNFNDEGRFLNGAYAGASLVNLPFLYTYKPEIKNAKLEVDKAQLNYISTQNKAIKDLNSAYEKFVTAKLNLNYYNEKLLKSSEEMIKLSKRSYEAGKSNLTSLIVMEQSYKSIIVGYTYALAEYYNCWIEFLRETNAEEFNLEAI
ncbi:MAG: hypothetical protein BHW55_02990 [Candidatus Melainabacteria bacterium 35_41]|nr:MAG: hypothetical protein BHW55_02990 [Candidatus Melainabacteria bacterium 35_41]